MVTANNDYTLYIDGSTYYAKDLITGDLQSNASFPSLISTLNTNLGTAGGTLRLRPGLYPIDTAQLNFTHPINMIGSGRGRTILQRQLGVNSTTINIGTVTGITISKLTVDGNYPTNSTNLFAEIANSSGTDIVLDDVEIKNFNNRGFNNSGPRAIARNCIFGPSGNTTSTSTGAFFSAANTFTVLDGCTIAGNAGGAVFSQGRTIVTDCYVGNNTATYGGGQLANGGAATTLIIKDCIIDPGPGTASDSGIEFSQVNAGIVPEMFAAVGNRITGGQGHGIVCDPNTVDIPVIVRNNVVRNFAGIGILMWGTNQKHFSIIGNVCYDDQATPTQKYGIVVGAISGTDATHTSADYYTIRNNLCYNNVNGQWLDMGTGTHKKVENNIVG